MTILKAENISKQYRLGNVGTGTLSHDLNRFWHNIRGKEDPYLKVGAVNDRSSKAKSDYVWALRDINFEVQEGEVLGIIGKNGAGKSTLLKILSRVTSPTTGVIKTKGRIASLLEVGTGFHPELTGRENIYLNGAILGMTRGEITAKLDEIVDFSGCEMYIGTPVKRYSSGMTVRLAFAVAAHLEPDILVVDEVLAVGDAEFQKKAIGKMQDISKGDGRTVLFVSHNMASVQNLCSRAILLKSGSIFIDGNVDEVVNEYLSIDSVLYSQSFAVLQTPQHKSVYIKSFKITSEVRTGATFSFEYEIVSQTEKQVDVAISFKTYQEVSIYQIYSGHTNEILILSNGCNKISGSIRELPLIQGDYSISLWIGSGAITFDFYPTIVRIKVLEGGFKKNHIAEYRNFPVIANANWTIND
ncbi:ATP-binding cassette domain-containing protein [Aequorivita sp. F47161]|uniref:ATP-binding cassette domain-containing protein n=1 Tax=Aequorivita vitellina TaxID=2874475 RepID=A0A9X1QY25_9FLAO|nr:ABC transporter ATP-binding protein [Aequorivita vitellina]MCG2419874.1 ATP-binding cassette domain-containing protein [Aequorivita vitellina]